MRNIQNINIRYGSGVPVPCDPLQDEKLSKLKGQESILNYGEFVGTLLNKVYENEDVRQFLSDNNIPLNHPVIWAMLQHYGYPTPFLDFSYSIDDSLFLANT